MRPVIGRRSRGWLDSVAVAFVAVVIGAAAASAEPSPAERGAHLYRVHCRSCHGESGRGDGALAAELATAPPDLTRLAEGGQFDSEAIRRSIDGRMVVPGHARSDMPVWGLTFEVQGSGVGRPDEVEGRLDDLVAYLRSIQAEKTGPESP